MNYKTREIIGNLAKNTSKNLRFRIRRNYLRNEIDRMDYKKKELSKEQKKAIDDYWKPYTKNICYKWHEFFYSITGIFDPRFIPEDLMFTDIECYLNNWESAHGIDNKNNYQYYFPEIKHPNVAFRRMSGIYHLGDYSYCSLDEALSTAEKFDNIIIKNTIEAGTGSSIRLWNKNDGIDKLRQIVLSSNDDIIAQHFIDQHPLLAEFNPSSVNSVRVVTLVINNKVEFLCAYLRVGQSGVKIDNVMAGGVCSAVSEDGYLCGYAYDKYAKKVFASPTGKEFKNFRIPAWDKILCVCKEMHKKMGNFRIISWDIAVDPDEEPVFIEMNLKYGAMEYHQLFKGPLFGDQTDQILNEVYNKQ